MLEFLGWFLIVVILNTFGGTIVWALLDHDGALLRRFTREKSMFAQFAFLNYWPLGIADRFLDWFIKH